MVARRVSIAEDIYSFISTSFKVLTFLIAF